MTDETKTALAVTPCPGCGYDRTSIANDRACPECGLVPPADWKPPVPLDARAKFGGGFLALAWGSVPAIFGTTMLFYVGELAPWLKSHGDFAVVLYIGAFALLSGLGFLPTYVQAIVGGWTFGLATGALGGIAGFVGGAAIGYLLTKLLAGEGIRRWIDAHPKGRVVREAFVERGFWRAFGTVALIRINSPFALTNLAMATSGVHWVPYLLGTAVGLTPRTLVAASIGAAAAAQGRSDFGQLAKDKPLVFYGFIAVFVVAIMLLTLIGQAALKKAGLVRPKTGGSEIGRA